MIHSAAFDKAIRSPQKYLLIEGLKSGAAEQVEVAKGDYTQRLLVSQRGARAIAYKYWLPSGGYKALRCFHSAVGDDLRQRYEQLSAYFHAQPREVREITADFSYHRQGIQTYEQGQRVTHPLLVMEWVDGGTMLDVVHHLCLRQDRQGLRALVAQWSALVALMDQNRLAHGDLSGENIMLRAKGGFVLIDLDSFYIPLFHGQTPPTTVQPDYQHPEWNQRAFNERMDDFARHVIFTSLFALQCEPRLWEMAHGAKKGTHLLFTQRDFLYPEDSPLFKALAQIQDPLLQREIQLLKTACRRSINDMQLPSLPESLPAPQPQSGSWTKSSDVSPVQARLDADTGEVIVAWSWPADQRVQFAAIAWRPDRWPACAQEVGTYLYHPVRRRPGQQGRFQFASPGTPLYLQVYWATPDHPTRHRRRVLWSYSSEETSRTTRCQLSRDTENEGKAS